MLSGKCEMLIVSLAACFIFCSAVASSDGNCPENWVQGIDYNCYYFEKEEMLTWQAAQDRCSEMGARLATIESWNEFYWMKGYRASDPLLRRIDVFVGGFKKGGNWYWKNGDLEDPMTVQAWITGQPDNYAGRQGCLTLISDRKHWNTTNPTARHEMFGYDDGYCDIYPQRFICETLIIPVEDVVG